MFWNPYQSLFTHMLCWPQDIAVICTTESCHLWNGSCHYCAEWPQIWRVWRETDDLLLHIYCNYSATKISSKLIWKKVHYSLGSDINIESIGVLQSQRLTVQHSATCNVFETEFDHTISVITHFLHNQVCETTRKRPIDESEAKRPHSKRRFCSCKFVRSASYRALSVYAQVRTQLRDIAPPFGAFQKALLFMYYENDHIWEASFWQSEFPLLLDIDTPRY